MDTKTEAKNEIQEPVAPQVSGIDSNDQDGQHRGGLWVLAVVLVAFAGLAAALAIEAFDGSNSNDAVDDRARGPEARLGLPPHPRAAVAQGPDRGRVRQRPIYLRRAIRGRAVEPPDYWLRPSRPRAVRQRRLPPGLRAAVAQGPQRPGDRQGLPAGGQPGRLAGRRSSRTDPGFPTRPTDPTGSTAQPARAGPGEQPTRCTAPPVRSAGPFARDRRCSPRHVQTAPRSTHASRDRTRDRRGPTWLTAADVPQRGVRSAKCRAPTQSGVGPGDGRPPSSGAWCSQVAQQREVNAMNTKTEAKRSEHLDPGADGAPGSGIDSNDQDRSAGTAGASGSSPWRSWPSPASPPHWRSRPSTARTGTTPSARCTWTRGSKPDFHRTPGQLSPKDPIPTEWDNDFHRVPGGVSPKDPSRLRRSTRTSSVRPTRPPSQEEVATGTPASRTRRRSTRTDPGFPTRPTDHQGQPLDPPAGPRAGNRTRWPHLRCGQRVSSRVAAPRSRPESPPHGRRVCQDRRPWRRPGRRRGAMAGPRLAPGAQVRALLSVARRRRFDRHEVVFHEGDPGDTVHLIARGRVALRVTTPLGDTRDPADPGSRSPVRRAGRPRPGAAQRDGRRPGAHRDPRAAPRPLRRAAPAAPGGRPDAAGLARRPRCGGCPRSCSRRSTCPVPQRVELRLIDLVHQYGGDGDGARGHPPHPGRPRRALRHEPHHGQQGAARPRGRRARHGVSWPRGGPGTGSAPAPPPSIPVIDVRPRPRRVRGMKVHDLPTPSLLVDVHAFDRNVATMAKRWPGADAAAPREGVQVDGAGGPAGRERAIAGSAAPPCGR